MLKRNAKMSERTGKAMYIAKQTMRERMRHQFVWHQRIAKQLLAARYARKCVIKNISVGKYGKVTKVYDAVTSNSPLVNMTVPDTDCNLKEETIIENDNNEMNYGVELGGEYVYYPQLTQVTCKSNSLQLKMTRLGFWAKEGEKVQFYAPSNTEGWTYYPGASVWGPSNEKHASKFFFSNDLSNEEWWKMVDELTGGSFEYFLSQKANPKDILKQASRLNMFGTTMELIGQIDLNDNYIVLVDRKIEATEDMTEEVRLALKKAGIEFGAEINDGKEYLITDLIENFFNISTEEALMISVQTRSNYIQTKCLAETFDPKGMKQIEANLKILFGDKVKVYGNTNGKCCLITDKNGAKLVNKNALEAGNKKIDVWGLAVAKASNSKTSTQLIAKMLEKDPEVATKRICELISEAVLDQFSNKLNATFNPTLGVNNNTGAILGSKCVIDEGYCYSTLHDMENFIKSAIADMKVPLDSLYDHVMFDDIFVQSAGLIEHLLGIRGCGEYGLLVEVFSKDFCVYYADEIAAIEEDQSLSEKDKKQKLDALCSAVIIKYPSAGAEEYLGVRYMTMKEWKLRCEAKIAEVKAKGKIYERLNLDVNKKEDVEFVEGLIEHIKNYCENISYGVTVFAAYNFIKNKLAGLDVDFDAILAILDAIKAVLLNREALNVLTYIDYFDESELDYSDWTETKEVKFNFNK